MAKDYNNPLDQMKAISYSLKRIADALESIDDKMQNDTSQLEIDSHNDLSELQRFVRNLDN